MIDLSLEPDARRETIFVNEDWCVLPDGLEHRTNGYFIARGTLAARREYLWEWPLHLAEKSWCRPRLLREAFMIALDRFEIEPDAHLARSFAVGFGIRSGEGDTTDGFVRLGEALRPKATRGGRSGAREAGRRRVAA